MEPRRRPRTLLVAYADAARSRVVDVAEDFDLFGFAELRDDGLWELRMHADYVRCVQRECAVLASFDPATSSTVRAARPGERAS